jgi:hypothetical protein
VIIERLFKLVRNINKTNQSKSQHTPQKAIQITTKQEQVTYETKKSSKHQTLIITPSIHINPIKCNKTNPYTILYNIKNTCSPPKISSNQPQKKKININQLITI